MLAALLYRVFSRQAVYSAEVCADLLADDGLEDEKSSGDGGKADGHEDSAFLPPRPFYQTLALRLLQWDDQRQFPIQHPKLEHCTILDEEYQRVYKLTSNVTSALAALPDEKGIIDLLTTLRLSGVLLLLGMQRTAGTLDLFPPTRRQLVLAFNEPCSAAAALSVGARALTKHFHRGTEAWWGNPLKKGNDVAKNAHANLLLNRILAEAVWVNMHQIVHKTPLLELRVREGYGARWSADGKVFRGFVEPQQADGHAKGWKH